MHSHFLILQGCGLHFDLNLDIDRSMDLENEMNSNIYTSP